MTEERQRKADQVEEIENGEDQGSERTGWKEASHSALVLRRLPAYGRHGHIPASNFIEG